MSSSPSPTHSHGAEVHRSPGMVKVTETQTDANSMAESAEPIVPDALQVARIKESIYNLIPLEELGIQKFYIVWSSLRNREKTKFNKLVEARFSAQRYQLFQIFMDVIEIWDVTQDKEGAPGCDPSLTRASKDPELILELRYMLMSIESLMHKYLAYLTQKGVKFGECVVTASKPPTIATGASPMVGQNLIDTNNNTKNASYNERSTS